MSEILNKYEISIWEDELVTLDSGSYYKEKKIAVIGSDSITAKSQVFSPVLTENVTGEKTLTFSLQYRYFDDRVGDFVTNPIYPLLVNERKIKLFYHNKWYDFLIKSCEESSEEYVFDYTATDLFINELSKQGYNITLDKELNNNTGTVVDLAKTIVKDTEWTVDEKDCDLLQQTVDEALYKCKVLNSFIVTNLSTNQKVTLNQNEIVYVFYSYISEKNGKYLQLLREADRNNWTYDDNNVIIGTNYRYNGTLTIKDNKISKDETDYLSIREIYFDNKGFRLVYQPKTVYDPVMERYVELYHIDFSGARQDVYKSTTSEYNTLGVIQSYFTNGKDFSTNDDGTPVGWDNLVLSSKNKLAELSVTSYPPLGEDTTPIELSKLNSMSSYLKVRFPGELSISKEGQYRNMIFNRGFMDNGATINQISKGEKYAFRIRCGKASDGARPVNLKLSGDTNSDLKVKAYVAFYKTLKQTIDGESVEVKTFSSKDIIFNFYNEFSFSPNRIVGGTFNESKTVYYVDNVPQTPSLRYCYRINGDNTDYIWDPNTQSYIPKTTAYLNYYITTAAAKKTVTNNDLTDPTVKIGVFLTTNDDELISGKKALYIDDVEIFKYEKDKEENVILPGNAPVSSEIIRTDYYLKPREGSNKAAVNFYATKTALANDLGIDASDIKQDYNDNSEKILSIEESKSNCFNLLQTLCETFECWLKITVSHNSDGSIKLNSKHKPIKKISFKEYIGRNNYAGFKYGINLESISRTIDSNEVVTKLIVAENQSDYVDDGIVTIAKADANPTGLATIYNFDYYIKKGLITNETQYKADLNNFYERVKAISKEIQDLSKLQSKATALLPSAQAQVTVLETEKEENEEAYAAALEEFKSKAEVSYSSYIKNHDTIEEPLLETVGKIYAASAARNNYSGVLTAAKQSYKKLKLDCEGAREYTITATTTKSTAEAPAYTRISVEDYIDGFEFTVYNENAEEVCSTSINEKFFEFEHGLNGRPYTYFKINSLPKGYEFQYVYLKDGKTYTTTGGTFAIYDIEENKELSRQFVLVPSNDYKKKYKGYTKQIQEKIEERNEIIKEFEHRYAQYVQEGTWESDTYIDSNLYYLDALQVSHTSAQPQVSYTINVSDVSVVEGLENYNFQIGDKTYIEDTEFFGWKLDIINNERIYTPIKEEVILSEIEWHLDDPSENIITVQNYKTQFEDLFQRISATVQSVQYNEASYTRAAKMLNGDGQIDIKLLQKSLNGLSGNEVPINISTAVEFIKDGIQAKDLANTQNLIKLVAQGLYSSKDGGETWTKLVSAEGVNTNSLTVGELNTQLISIVDGDNTSFRWDKNGLSAYGFNEGEGYDLTSFVRMDKYGLYGIKNGDEYVVTSLEDLKDKAHFSLTWDGFRIKNTYGNGYVSISSDNDFEVVKTIPNENRGLLSAAANEQEITKIHIGALDKDVDGTPLNYGIVINNDNGEPVFATDESGNLAVTGEINATAGTFDGKITVGGEARKYIVINAEGEEPFIASSDYVENTSTGWVINGTGDAIFNNVSVRGAIKTAVFEYSEIEAVGGAFLFRPSSSIKDATFDNIYKLSTDTVANDEKRYFQKEEQFVLTEVAPYDSTKNPHEEGWYEILDNGDVILTEDTIWESTGGEYEETYKSYYIGELVDVYNGIDRATIGEYITSSDSIRNDYKKYYSYSEDTNSYQLIDYYEYDLVDSVKHPAEENWYELVEENNYVLSEDLEVDFEKEYYELTTNNSYVLVDFSHNPSQEGWYEISYSAPQGINPKNNMWYESIEEGIYELTEDTEIFLDKEYYTLAGENQYSLVEYEPIRNYVLSIDSDMVDGKEYYKLVESADYIIANTNFSPIEEGWYEETIEETSIYGLTQDTEIFSNKTYFVLTNESEYIIIEPEENPAEEGLYEIVEVVENTVYVPSEDFEIELGKNYYVLNDDEYILAKIVPSEMGWFELTEEGIYQSTEDSEMNWDKEYYVFSQSSDYIQIILNYNPLMEEWYEKEGSNYIRTEDTEVAEGKEYYSLMATNEYTLLNNSSDLRYSPVEEGWYESTGGYRLLTNIDVGENPSANEWYELNNGEYILTSDTSVVDGKNYYTSELLRFESWGTINEYPYNFYKRSEDEYTITEKTYYRYVENGEQNPQELEWYESQLVNPVEKGWYEVESSGLVLTVEKPLQFRKNEWVKLSNCTGEASSVLNDGGLTHVYKVANDPTKDKVILLEGAEKDFTDGTQMTIQGNEPAGYSLDDLIGGALISFGYDTTDPLLYENGVHNYGIGINSSDNYVGLPERAISLFESNIHPDRSVKVTYDYKGILGTLPPLGNNLVNQPVYNNMAGTQGIFTNNMYIGDNNQYLAFYTDQNGKKHLKISAKEIVYEINEQTGEETTWEDKIDEASQGADGEDAISTYIDSSAGNIFVNGVVSTILRCYVYKGGIDITNDNSYIKTYTWTKVNVEDGSIIQDWTPTAVPLEPNAIRITADDVTYKAVFQCSVDVEEA